MQNIFPTLQPKWVSTALKSGDLVTFGRSTSLFRRSQLWLGFNSCCISFGFKNYCSSFGFSSSCCSCHVHCAGAGVDNKEETSWKNMAWVELSGVLYSQSRMKMMRGILQLEIFKLWINPPQVLVDVFWVMLAMGVLSMVVKGPPIGLECNFMLFPLLPLKRI